MNTSTTSDTRSFGGTDLSHLSGDTLRGIARAYGIEPREFDCEGDTAVRNQIAESVAPHGVLSAYP